MPITDIKKRTYEILELEVVDYDRYKRTVGYVILPNGRVVNEELVKAGMCWWYRRYAPSDKRLAEEEEARLPKRGLWVDPNPVPPWEWRVARRRYRYVFLDTSPRAA